METLRALASRLDEAAATAGAAASRVARIEPPASAFGADGPGELADQGRDLHSRWVAVIGARTREAAAVADRLADLAAGVRQAAHSYAETDHAAHRRHPGQA
ncbi:MAG TPA: hypothetical protein VGD43_22900 [Micromonospora sp.]